MARPIVFKVHRGLTYFAAILLKRKCSLIRQPTDMLNIFIQWYIAQRYVSTFHSIIFLFREKSEPEARDVRRDRQGAALNAAPYRERRIIDLNLPIVLLHNIYQTNKYIRILQVCHCLPANPTHTDYRTMCNVQCHCQCPALVLPSCIIAALYFHSPGVATVYLNTVIAIILRVILYFSLRNS